MTVPEQQDVAAIVAGVLVHHAQTDDTPAGACGCGAELKRDEPWPRHVAVVVAQELDAAGITTPVLPEVSGPEVWLVEPDPVHNAVATRADVDHLPAELTASRRDLAVWAALVGFTADALSDELRTSDVERMARPTGPPAQVSLPTGPPAPDPSWQPLSAHQQAGVPQWHQDAWQATSGDEAPAVPVFGAVPDADEPSRPLVPALIPPASRCLTCPGCRAKVWPDEEDADTWLCNGDRADETDSHPTMVMVDLGAELPELPEGAEVVRCPHCWAMAALLPGGPESVQCDGSLHGELTPLHTPAVMVAPEEVDTGA